MRQLNYVEKLEELSESEEAYVYDLAMGEIERLLIAQLIVQPDPILPDEYKDIGAVSYTHLTLPTIYSV